jgi:ribonuclease R
VVEITEQPGRNRDPVGRVLRVLPDSGGANSAIELAIASHGLANEFSSEALAVARSYGREVRRRR